MTTVEAKLKRLARYIGKLQSGDGSDIVREDLLAARDAIDAALDRLERPGYPKACRPQQACVAMVRPTVGGI